MTDLDDIQTDESWQLASCYMQLVTIMPPRILYAFKALRKLHIDSLDRSSDVDIDQAFEAMGFDSNTVLRPIDDLEGIQKRVYLGAQRLFPERFGRSQDVSSRAIYQALGPGLFSTFLILVWFLRRIKKHADEELWQEYAYDCMAATEIGYRLGTQIPALGSVDGSFLGLIRYVGVGTFFMKGNDLYRRYRNLHKGRLDIEFEESRWGCDHAQVATMLLQFLGFKSEEVSGVENWNPIDVAVALRGDLEKLNKACNPIVIRWAQCCAFMNSVMAGDKRLDVLEDQGITEEAALNFYRKCTRIVKDELTFTWMLR